MHIHKMNIYICMLQRRYTPFRGMPQQRKGTKNPENIPPNGPYENCSHFWEIVRFSGGRFGGSKNIFNLCYHIELNTQNPNLILKITIPFTKTPKMPKYFRSFGKIRKYQKQIFIL